VPVRVIVLTSAALGLALFAAASADVAAPALRGSNPYGVLLNSGRTSDSAAIRDTFAMVREAGIGCVRTPFFWHMIEPTPGRFRWARYDAMAEAARANGIEILGILGSARLGHRVIRRPGTTSSLRATRKFSPAMLTAPWLAIEAPSVLGSVERARSRGFLEGVGRGRPLAHVYPRIKAANPGAQVLLGGLAQGGAYDPRFRRRVRQARRAAELLRHGQFMTIVRKVLRRK
jgi:hypothetical protein